ncbi:fatty acyl-CoA reductase 2, chloroplastic-like [Salvia splendens]|uniref:fatty acyl-CoA reductase 2, chloroplastic-like n=1 Tax=Salvia splendens TaxID=180675 RepID=UPI0011036617|nr:fatty acyl-CoA reductase 2, chloroplastic-like [Salvia splendens]
MLLSNIKFPLAKFPKTSNYNHFPFSNISSVGSKKVLSSGKMKVLIDGYTYFNSPSHPLEAELHHQEFNEAADNGIGILPFFQGKNILLTGATGLLGKVLVEKILRSMSVGKIYVLIKAKDKEAALTRLTNEITNSDLFKTLKQELGDSYEAMVREKLVPIAGNICEPNLGMDSESIARVRKDVDVIIQSAASTILNDRYDLLVDANMSAPQRLMRFAKTCNNLTLFAHISTAYVSGKREGLIMERPFIMGENGRKEELYDESTLLDIIEENNLILKSSSSTTNHDLTKNLKRLAQDRATLFGWHNSYHMTKAMGEMALDDIRGDVPLLIIRPTVIESTYKEPFPGWIQGNRMFDPVIMAYGKGQLPGFFGDSQVIMDIIPVDMVANTTIAAIAKEGNMHGPHPQPRVYHVASSATNPLLYSDFFEYLFHYFNSSPLIPSQEISRIKYFDNFQDFSEYTRNAIHGDKEKMPLKSQNQAKAKAAYADKLCKLYEFIGFFNARFDTGNTEKLIEAMSKEEKLSFEVDARNIEWKKYFEEIHIPGLIKHIINGTI